MPAKQHGPKGGVCLISVQRLFSRASFFALKMTCSGVLQAEGPASKRLCQDPARTAGPNTQLVLSASAPQLLSNRVSCHDATVGRLVFHGCRDHPLFRVLQ